MDLLFRRYFWMIKLLFIGGGAFLLCAIVNLIIDYQIQKRFSVEHRIVRLSYQSPFAEDKDFSYANERNIFGASREAISWSDVQSSATEEDGSWENASPTSLNIQLVGTSVFADPYRSLATIIDLTKSEANLQTYSIRECAAETLYADPALQEILGRLSSKSSPFPCNRMPGGAILRRIEPSRIVFFNESSHRYEYLILNGVKQSQVPTFKTPPIAANTEVPDISKLGNSIKELGPGNFEISTQDLEDALNNLAYISTQARAVPAFENGKSIGFKMVSIQPGSVFSKIGLKVGDIITKINGYDLNSPDKALEVYQKLRTAKRFNIDLKHEGGASANYNYSVR